MVDMSITGPNPVISKVRWVGRYQLKFGMVQHADSQYSRVKMTDELDFLGTSNFYGSGKKSYTYY